jgi:hypothetical protein
MKYLGLVVLCAFAISVVIHLGTFTSAQTVQGQVPLIVGNWKLNTEKSNLPCLRTRLKSGSTAFALMDSSSAC